MNFSDEQLLRYSRQILLPDIELDGQQRLARARVLIVGLGGLGSPAAMYLAAAGVGNLVLADGDHVDLSNLQRQLLHATPDLGERKTDSARRRLRALNPEVQVRTIAARLADGDLATEAGAADVVVDATDNFTSRFAINRACRAQRTPLVYGAAIRFEGQLSVFDARDPQSPCYRCLYDDTVADQHETCDAIGVVAPLLGIIGAVQAMETLKLLLGIGQTLSGRLLLLDAHTMQWQDVQLPRDPACPVCSATG